MNSRIDVLVDSTFLLPTLGVKVTQISDSDMRELAKLRPKVSYFCLQQSLVEILGKIARAIPIHTEVSPAVEAGLRSILESGVYAWLTPSVEEMLDALQIRTKGHTDMIDNMLYATASNRGMLFLSLDRELIDFLNINQYSTSNIVDVKKLRTRLG